MVDRATRSIARQIGRALSGIRERSSQLRRCEVGSSGMSGARLTSCLSHAIRPLSHAVCRSFDQCTLRISESSSASAALPSRLIS